MHLFQTYRIGTLHLNHSPCEVQSSLLINSHSVYISCRFCHISSTRDWHLEEAIQTKSIVAFDLTLPVYVHVGGERQSAHYSIRVPRNHKQGNSALGT